MKISEFILKNWVRLPPLIITSLYRSNSSHHSKYEAFDFIPIWKNFPTIAGQSIEPWKLDLYLARYLADNYPGGLGVNFSGRCRHFHLDSGSKRVWEEYTTSDKGSCSSNFKTKKMRDLPNIPTLLYPFFSAFLSTPLVNVDQRSGKPLYVALKQEEVSSSGGIGSILLIGLLAYFLVSRWR